MAAAVSMEDENLVSKEETVKDLNDNYVKDCAIKVEKIEINEPPPRKLTQKISSNGNGEQTATSGGDVADIYSRPKPPSRDIVGLSTPCSPSSLVLKYDSKAGSGADKNSSRSPGGGHGPSGQTSEPPKGGKGATKGSCDGRNPQRAEIPRGHPYETLQAQCAKPYHGASTGEDLTISQMYQFLLGVGT